MADAGFNKIQLKQLESLFDKNNDQTSDSIVHVVDSLSETIENVKNLLSDKIESEVKALKRGIKDDIQNLTITLDFVIFLPAFPKLILYYLKNR